MGLIASAAAPILSFQVFARIDSAFLNIFGIPVLVLVLGILLAIWGNRALWVPFLISYVFGFIVFAGLCVSLLNSIG